MSQRYSRILSTIAWVYFIFMAYMLLKPHPPTDIIPPRVFGLVHFYAFLVLGALVGFARRVWSYRAWANILWIWCIASEFLQNYTGRSCEVMDMVQNFFGVCTGLFVAKLTRQRTERPARPGAIAILLRPPLRLSDLETLDWSRAEVLVIRRSQKVVAPGALCFPGGGIEPHETPRDAVCREFQEEVGLLIDSVVDLTTTETPSGAPLHWFIAQLGADESREIEIVVDREEVAEYFWSTLPALMESDDFLSNNRVVISQILSGDLVAGSHSE